MRYSWLSALLTAAYINQICKEMLRINTTINVLRMVLIRAGLATPWPFLKLLMVCIAEAYLCQIL